MLHSNVTLKLLLGGLLLTGCANSAANSPTSTSYSPALATTTAKNNLPEGSVANAESQKIAMANNLLEKGKKAQEKGQHQEAIKAFQRSVKLNPDNLSGYQLLSEAQFQAGEQEAAIATLQTALKRKPNDIAMLNTLGMAYLSSDRLTEAERILSQVTDLQPSNKTAYFSLSLVQQRLRQFERAIENAQRAAKLEPENPHPLVVLAVTQWDMGDQTKAVQTYKQVLKKAPQYGNQTYLIYLKPEGFNADQIQVVEAVLTATKKKS
uniref:Tetratricopeptide TPR_2 repeat protein n=1 Tax=Cyanothece sp. (strain PCC 7425 / ATCC 29141) TaxID=395961 RepID=B8HU88_CYAP4